MAPDNSPKTDQRPARNQETPKKTQVRSYYYALIRSPFFGKHLLSVGVQKTRCHWPVHRVQEGVLCSPVSNREVFRSWAKTKSPTRRTTLCLFLVFVFPVGDGTNKEFCAFYLFRWPFCFKMFEAKSICKKFGSSFCLRLLHGVLTLTHKVMYTEKSSIHVVVHQPSHKLSALQRIWVVLYPEKIDTQCLCKKTPPLRSPRQWSRFSSSPALSKLAASPKCFSYLAMG